MHHRTILFIASVLVYYSSFSAFAAGPTPAFPVSDTAAQAVLTREAEALQATPPAQVRAHATAEALYGAIPAGAPRVTRTVRVDTAQPRWHSTGLYAAPGELVTIKIPPTAIGKWFKVRLGGHKDNISKRPNWQRMPFGISRVFDATSTTLQAADAFGGAIYLELGPNPPALPPFEVTISGAIEAPYFVLGKTTDADWVASLRDKPAPYAELECPGLVISLPSRAVRKLDNPTAVMEFWNRAVAAEDDLCGAPNPRTSPERIDLDVQISAGYLHSGYPIMGPVSTAAEIVSLARLTGQGNWGYFHELGHNHQKPWWTFAGDTEVTVNIFSNCLMEQFAPRATGGWAWGSDPAEAMRHAIIEVKTGGTYSSKKNRWAFWFQLADGFGWENYRRVFREYLDLKPAQRPKTEQDKKDQWMVRFSRAAGFNLTRFMRDTWGLEVTPQAAAQLKDLPDWMPLVPAVAQVAVAPGASRVLNPTSLTLSMDGVVKIKNVATVAHGTLTPDGKGNWTYAPAAGYLGPDAVSYQAISSAGNMVNLTIKIEVKPYVPTSPFSSSAPKKKRAKK